MFFEKKKDFFFCIIFTMIIGLITHGMNFLRVTFTHDSLWVNSNADYPLQLALGRYLQIIGLKFRGGIVIPWVIGLLGLLFIGIGSYFVFKIFDVKKKWAKICIIGLMVTNITVLATSATYIDKFDLFMFSMMCSVISVYFLEHKYGLIISGLLLWISMGIYQAHLGVYLGLCMLVGIKKLIEKEELNNLFKYIGKVFLVIICGGLLYWIGNKIAISITGVMNDTDTYNGIGNLFDFSNISIFRLLVHTYTYPFKYIGIKFKWYVEILIYLILMIGIYGLIKKIINLDNKYKLLVIGIVLLLPLGIDCIYFITKELLHDVMAYSYIVPLIGAICILEKSGFKEIEQGILLLIVGCLIWSNVIFANRIYVKKELDFVATEMLINRIVERIENVEGYKLGVTPVVFVGSVDDSPLNIGREGFEFDTLTGSSGYMYGITYYKTWELYFKNIMSYPINILDEEKAMEYKNNNEVKEMPLFPNNGSIKMIDGVVVVKMSE